MNEAELYGQGVAFPPRISAEGRWQLSTGAENIRDAIKIILLTAPNERILMPNFGCGLHQYLF
ncbi:MAG: phage tail protein, partial [Calditrichaeota bacterium]